MTNDSRIRTVVWSHPNAILCDGPIIPVEVARVGSDDFIKAVALIDTGADGCVMTSRLVAQLGARPIGTIEAHEAGREPMNIGCVEATLRLPPSVEIDVPFGVLDFSAGPAEVLIGRDLFRDGLLVVDYRAGRIEMRLSF